MRFRLSILRSFEHVHENWPLTLEEATTEVESRWGEGFSTAWAPGRVGQGRLERHLIVDSRRAETAVLVPLPEEGA